MLYKQLRVLYLDLYRKKRESYWVLEIFKSTSSDTLLQKVDQAFTSMCQWGVILIKPLPFPFKIMFGLLPNDCSERTQGGGPDFVDTPAFTNYWKTWLTLHSEIPEIVGIKLWIHHTHNKAAVHPNQEWTMRTVSETHHHKMTLGWKHLLSDVLPDLVGDYL